MSDVAVLLITCDHYSATWPPFCHGVKKYWPDRPWPLYAVTNYSDFPCADEVIKVGEEDPKDWASKVITALEYCKAPILMPMLDDFWLTGPVHTDVLMEFADHVRQGRADLVRLWDSLQPRHDNDGYFKYDPRLFIFARHAKYRACTAVAFWKREAFRKMLVPGETVWNFEGYSRERTEGSLKYVCVRKTEEFGDMGYFPYTVGDEWGYSVVAKGKWFWSARKYAEREGLCIDFSKNPGKVGYGGFKG